MVEIKCSTGIERICGRGHLALSNIKLLLNWEPMPQQPGKRRQAVTFGLNQVGKPYSMLTSIFTKINGIAQNYDGTR